MLNMPEEYIELAEADNTKNWYERKRFAHLPEEHIEIYLSAKEMKNETIRLENQ